MSQVAETSHKQVFLGCPFVGSLQLSNFFFAASKLTQQCKLAIAFAHPALVTLTGIVLPSYKLIHFHGIPSKSQPFFVIASKPTRQCKLTAPCPQLAGRHRLP